MSNAKKILERMRLSANGWGQDDFRKLYEGYGFEETGTKHSIYKHPQYPYLRATVGRHDSLATGYATHAVKLIDQLILLKGNDDQNET